MLFGMGNAFAQEQKAAKQNEKISEVILATEMHCQNCADKVTKQLAYTKGVVDVQANHEKDAVYIKYRNDRTNNEKLIASLKEIGFEAKVFNACGQCPHSKGGACANKSGCCSQKEPAQKAAPCNGNHSECQHKHNDAKK